LNISATNDALIFAVITLQVERVKTLKEMAEKSRYFFEDEIQYDETAVQQQLTPDIKSLLVAAKTAFENLSDWTKDSLHQAIMMIAQTQGVKMGQLAQPLRVAITGSTISPSIDSTLQWIGKERVLKRLCDAIAMIMHARQ
jgi:glutamyl-tRNA synthetase